MPKITMRYIWPDDAGMLEVKVASDLDSLPEVREQATQGLRDAWAVLESAE